MLILRPMAGLRFPMSFAGTLCAGTDERAGSFAADERHCTARQRGTRIRTGS